MSQHPNPQQNNPNNNHKNAVPRIQVPPPPAGHKRGRPYLAQVLRHMGNNSTTNADGTSTNNVNNTPHSTTTRRDATGNNGITTTNSTASSTINKLKASGTTAKSKMKPNIQQEVIELLESSSDEEDHANTNTNTNTTTDAAKQPPPHNTATATAPPIVVVPNTTKLHNPVHDLKKLLEKDLVTVTKHHKHHHKKQKYPEKDDLLQQQFQPRSTSSTTATGSATSISASTSTSNANKYGEQTKRIQAFLNEQKNHNNNNKNKNENSASASRKKGDDENDYTKRPALSSHSSSRSQTQTQQLTIEQAQASSHSPNQQHQSIPNAAVATIHDASLWSAVSTIAAKREMSVDADTIALASQYNINPPSHYPLSGPFVQGVITNSMTIFQSLEGSDKSRVQGAISKILQVVGKDRMNNLKLSKLPTSVEEIKQITALFYDERKRVVSEVVQISFIEMKKRHDRMLKHMRTNFELLLKRRYADIQKKRSAKKNSELNRMVAHLNEEHEEQCNVWKERHHVLLSTIKKNHEENMKRLIEERDTARENNKRALESYLLASSIIFNKKPRTTEAKDVISPVSPPAEEIDNK